MDKDDVMRLKNDITILMLQKAALIETAKILLVIIGNHTGEEIVFDRITEREHITNARALLAQVQS